MLGVINGMARSLLPKVAESGDVVSVSQILGIPSSSLKLSLGGKIRESIKWGSKSPSNSFSLRQIRILGKS